MINLGFAGEIFYILSDELQKIVKQGGACNDLSAAQVNEAVLQTIALCAPAVLIEQKKRLVR